jgi:chemotaxis protein methyltransferase CheR
MSPHPERTAAGTGPIAASTPLRDEEFDALRRLIHDRAGIVLNESKKALVASRLARRLRVLQLDTYGRYYERVTRHDPDGSEMRELLNSITTNKTDFFRESHHFDFLRTQGFAEAIERSRRGGPRRLRIWSAGCSTGEEPYTIAMVLRGAFPESGWKFEILATDLDTDVLARAAQAEFDESVLAPVPDEWKRRFFRRGTGANTGRVRATDELRGVVEFRRLNFIERPWPVQGPFDFVFCRNVMIYFDPPTQQGIVREFARLLVPRGVLFVGHSESLQGVQDVYEPMRGTMYRLRGGPGEPAAAAPPAPRTTAPAPPARPAAPGLAAPARGAAGSTAPGRSPLDPARRRVNIIIGGVQASREALQLRTLLGSCVAACLHDPVARVGGMNHFLLPDSGDADASTRYGVNAMEMLINDMLKLGADRRRFQAKVFGAAHVLVDAGLSADVPRKNAEFVKRFLAREGIPLVSSRLGGSAPVEVLFETDTGRALARGLGDTAAADLAREESKYELEVSRRLVVPAEGSVELF